jgi:hypothetical protein
VVSTGGDGTGAGPRSSGAGWVMKAWRAPGSNHAVGSRDPGAPAAGILHRPLRSVCKVNVHQAKPLRIPLGPFKVVEQASSDTPERRRRHGWLWPAPTNDSADRRCRVVAFMKREMFSVFWIGAVIPLDLWIFLDVYRQTGRHPTTRTELLSALIDHISDREDARA